MITRIFTVRIHPELRNAFEQGFTTVSVAAVQDQPGCMSHVIGFPTAWSPDEYMMLSVWDSEESLRRFAGTSWNQPVIPRGMERFVAACRVDHFITGNTPAIEGDLA